MAGDFLHPGAVIVALCEDPPFLVLADYNGDECVIPCRMTARVNEFGMFEPLIEPEESPAENPSE